MGLFERFRRSRVAPSNNGSPNGNGNGNATKSKSPNGNGWKNLSNKTNGGLAIEYKKGIFGVKYRTKNKKTPVYKYNNYGYDNYSTVNRNIRPIVMASRSKVRNNNPNYSTGEIAMILYHSGLASTIPSMAGGQNHNATGSEMRQQKATLEKIKKALANTGPGNAILRQLVNKRLGVLN